MRIKSVGKAVLAIATALVMLCSCALDTLIRDDGGKSTHPDYSAAKEAFSEQATLGGDYTAQTLASEYPEPYENTASAEYFLNGESDGVREAYRTLYEGIFNYQTSITLPENVIESESFGNFLSFTTATGVCADSLETDYKMYVNDGGYVTRVEVSYSQSRADGAKQYSELLARANDIVADVQNLKSDYEKIKYFHDTIIKGCEYSSESTTAHSAYGALCAGSAVCEGYAKAFLLLCELAEIECLPIMGSSTDTDGLVQSHMWNKVCCDGVWYNLDCTWDDPTGTDYSDNVRYDYFLISDEEIAVSHAEENNRYMTTPAAWDTQGSYFVREGTLFGYYTDVYSEIYEQVRQCFSGENESAVIMYKCADEQIFDSVKSELLEENEYGEREFVRILQDFISGGELVSYIYSDNERMHTVYIRLLIDN